MHGKLKRDNEKESGEKETVFRILILEIIVKENESYLMSDTYGSYLM